MNDERKLIIHPQKYGGESAIISMRMPKNMLREIDLIATKTGRTRNEILMKSVSFALQNVEIIEM